MNLRERHKLRTRRALSDAALALFLERGFDATTIEDVVTAAGVSRRTFFRYFPTKEAVFFAHREARLAAFEARLPARSREVGAWTAVREGLLAIASTWEHDRDQSLAWRRVLRSSDRLQAHDLQQDTVWEQRIAAALEAGGMPGLEAAVRAGAVMGLLRAVVVAWCEDGARGDLDALGRQAFGWIEAGIDPSLVRVSGRTSP